MRVKSLKSSDIEEIIKQRSCDAHNPILSSNEIKKKKIQEVEAREPPPNHGPGNGVVKKVVWTQLQSDRLRVKVGATAGWGSIESDDGEVYFNSSHLVDCVLDHIKQGTKVSFSLDPTVDSLYAKQVRLRDEMD